MTEAPQEPTVADRVAGVVANPASHDAWRDLAYAVSDSDAEPPSVLLPSEAEAVVADPQRCFIRALGCPLDTAAGGVEDVASTWFNAGISMFMHGPSVVTLTDGAEVTGLDCMQRCLELDPGVGRAWKSAGLEVGGGSITVGQRRYGALECYAHAAAFDAEDGTCWELLGRRMQQAHVDAAPVPVVDGGRATGAEVMMDVQDVLVRAVTAEYPARPPAWTALGHTVSYRDRGATVSIGGTAYTAPQLFLKAAVLEGNDPLVWCNVGVVLEKAGVADVALPDGSHHIDSYAACFAKALELDPSCDGAWNDAGTTLGTGDAEGKLFTVGENAYTKQQCLVKAVELNPQYALAWYNLASTLLAGETVAVGGSAMSRVACIGRALELRRHPAFIRDLGVILALGCDTEGSSVVLDLDGPTTVTALYCYEEALRLDPTCPVAWETMAEGMRDAGQDSVVIAGTAFSCRGAFREAARLWSEEVEAMAQDKADATRIGGHIYTAQSCLLHAGSCDAAADALSEGDAATDAVAIGG